MALSDFFKGSQHRANAERLEAELHTHRQQSEKELQAITAKHDTLEAVLKRNGMLTLIEAQNQVQAEKIALASIQGQVEAARRQLEAAQSQLKEIQKQILGAEDTVLLESFALYEPKYQFTNSIDYKHRLDEIREDQKQTARRLSAEVDAWDNYAVELTKAQWKKLRKDALKLALRSFNSESEYCIDNVKFSNMEKME